MECNLYQPLDLFCVGGAVCLAAVTGLFMTNIFFDPETRLTATGKVEMRVNPFSNRESAPLWYWVTNLCLVALCFGLILVGLTCERWVDCSSSAPTRSRIPKLRADVPFYPLLAFHVVAAVVWMPFMLAVRQLISSKLVTMNAGVIVTRQGLRVTIPAEVLLDSEALRRYLSQYRDHPDYIELCNQALSDAARVKSAP